MSRKNPAVDAYIAASAPFARPILKRIRKLFHQACPEIQEEMKWSFPHFTHKGIVGSMAAFKQHASYGFWRGKELPDPHGLFNGVGDTGMSASKVTSVDDLPADDVIIEYILAAVALNEAGPVRKPAKKATAKRPPPEVPADFRAALDRSAAARKTFDAFSASCQREYVEWIVEAKQAATRERRIATAIEQLAEGKKKNWKYENC